MTQIVRDVFVSCPPTHVFDLLSAVERLPEFSDMTVEVRNGPGRPLATGDRFDQIVKVFGVHLDTEWEVTNVQPNEKIELKGLSKSNGRATLSQSITPESAGCRVTFEIDYDPPFGILGEIADKAVFERHNEGEAEQILAKLKALCEAAKAR